MTYPLKYSQTQASGEPHELALQRSAAMLPAFLTGEQKLRLAKINYGRDLFAGRWRKVLINEGRTAHVFKAIKTSSGQERALLVVVNMLALASRKTADLLMLNAPGITAPADNVVQQEAIDRINRDSWIEATLYDGALTSTYEGEAWVQVMRWREKTILANVPADQCFPVGTMNPDGSYDQVEKVFIITRGSGQQRRDYLRKEIHSAGLITNELYQLNSRGAIDARLDWANGAAAAGIVDAGPELVPTGVDAPLLDYCPNFTTGGQCLSDYDGCESLIDQFTAAISQAARVLALHADPKLGLPESMVDEDTGRVNAEDDAFVFVTKDESPMYLVWNAQMDAALKAIDLWLDWLMVTIEMSPGLLGLRKGAAPDAFKKLRLEAVNTLSKVARKKIYWTRFLADMYGRAHALDNASPGQRYDFGPVGIDWNDGIPLDEAERIADVIDTRTAGLVDRQTAVEQVHGPEAAVEVNERLDAEDAAGRTVTMNLGEHDVETACLPAGR